MERKLSINHEEISELNHLLFSEDECSQFLDIAIKIGNRDRHASIFKQKTILGVTSPQRFLRIPALQRQADGGAEPFEKADGLG